VADTDKVLSRTQATLATSNWGGIQPQGSMESEVVSKQLELLLKNATCLHEVLLGTTERTKEVK